MKKFFLLAVALANFSILFAQIPKLSVVPKLYIIDAGNRQAVFNSDQIASEDVKTGQTDLIYINVRWIEKISIVKGKEAIDKYGSRGENGVVLMSLSSGALKEMSKKDRKKFKHQRATKKA